MIFHSDDLSQCVPPYKKCTNKTIAGAVPDSQHLQRLRDRGQERRVRGGDPGAIREERDGVAEHRQVRRAPRVQLRRRQGVRDEQGGIRM